MQKSAKYLRLVMKCPAKGQIIRFQSDCFRRSRCAYDLVVLWEFHEDSKGAGILLQLAASGFFAITTPARVIDRMLQVDLHSSVACSLSFGLSDSLFFLLVFNNASVFEDQILLQHHHRTVFWTTLPLLMVLLEIPSRLELAETFTVNVPESAGVDLLFCC